MVEEQIRYAVGKSHNDWATCARIISGSSLYLPDSKRRQSVALRVTRLIASVSEILWYNRRIPADRRNK